MSDENSPLVHLFGPGRDTRELLAGPGIWIPAHELTDDQAAEDRPTGLRFLRRIESESAGAEANPAAVRYDVVVRNEMGVGVRRAAAGAGAIATVGSVAALAAGIPWGVISLLAGIALLATGIIGGDESLTFHPSPTGRWVEEDAELPAAEPHPRFARWERVLYGTLAAAFATMALTGRIEGNLLLVGTVSAGLAVAAAWDSLPLRRRDPNNAMLADLRFRELADPTRPLAPEDVRLSPSAAGAPGEG